MSNRRYYDESIRVPTSTPENVDEEQNEARED